MMEAAADPTSYQREEFIRVNLPLIRQIAGQHTGRVLEWGRDEELSIALLAFNSAIDVFEYRKNQNFLGLATLIIKRRLTDYYRAASRRRHREFPAGDLINDLSDAQLARPGYIESLVSQERRKEIEAFTRELSKLGIGLSELVVQAPKHGALRERLHFVVDVIIGNPQLYQSVLASGRLPLERVSNLTGVSAAVLSKRRKYLLAVIHVYANISEYPFISTYLNLGGEKE